jgi:phosphate transport system substrate-binding protein
MKIIRKMKDTSFLCSLTLAAATLVPALAAADTVNLSSQDGSVNITGEFVSFEENIYLIRTALGELRLSAERVRCTGDACPTFEEVEPSVTFAGSDTVGLGVMPLLLEGFAGQLDAESTAVATNKANEIIASFIGDNGFGDEMGAYLVSSTTSGNAFSALLNKQAEIGMASRRINTNEANALRAAGGGDMVNPSQEHIVAIDSIVVITHPDNPIKSIGMDDLANIYSGKTTNWAQLGGPDLPIRVLDRNADSGTRAVFSDRVFGKQTGTFTGATVVDDNTEMATAVGKDAGAIGYTGYAFQRGNNALSLVNECGIAMQPDAFSARTEEYALQRRLYLYNRADTTSQATQQFLNYATSPDADDLITKAGFIDLGVARRSQADDSLRAEQMRNTPVKSGEAGLIQDMLGEMPEFDRLSTTFRFRTGSSQLDERAVTDMERLTAFLETQPKGTKIKIVGFTDSVGKFENNRRLAQGRANQVQSSLASFAGDRIAEISVTTAAYGELAPSACNISDTGRAINRRVEVWIEADQKSKVGT